MEKEKENFCLFLNCRKRLHRFYSNKSKLSKHLRIYTSYRIQQMHFNL
jgi:hypothetical protein